METPPQPESPGAGFTSLKFFLFMLLCSLICVEAWIYFLVRLLEDFARSRRDVAGVYSGWRREMREPLRGDHHPGAEPEIPLCHCQRPAAVPDDPPPRYPDQSHGHGEEQHRRRREIRAEREAERAGYVYEEVRRIWRRERDRRQARRVLRDLLGYPRLARRQDSDGGGAMSVSGWGSGFESSSGWDSDSSGGSEAVVVRGRSRHRGPRRPVIDIDQHPERSSGGQGRPSSREPSPSVAGAPDALGIDNREHDQHPNQPPAASSDSDSDSDPWDHPPPPPSLSLASDRPDNHPEDQNHAAPEDPYLDLQRAHDDLVARHRFNLRRFRKHMAECQDYRRRHDNLVRRHKVLIDELSAARNHSRKRARRRRDSDTDHGNRGRDPRSAEPPVWRPRRVRSEDLEVLSQQQAVGEEVTGDAGPVIPQINVSPAPAPPPRQESDRVPVSRAVLSAVESVRPHGNRDLDHTTRGAILRPCQSRSPSPLDLGLSDWIRLESDLANDITIPPPPPPSESDGNHHEAGCSCRGQAQRHAANEPGALRAEADDAVRAAGGQRRFPLVNHALEEYLVLN